MSKPSRVWSVLTKSVGPEASPAPTEAQTRTLLELLPDTDAWIQYPPASGRGHAFESRFWLDATDASAAGARGAALVADAQRTVGLDDWTVVRLHAASLDERAIEYYPGLEGRAADDGGWSIMHRVQLPADEHPVDAGEREAILAALRSQLPGVPEHAIASGSSHMVECRFWVIGADAVQAAARAEAAVAKAMRADGRLRWTTVRIQTASVAERRREMYLGVERRLSERDGV